MLLNPICQNSGDSDTSESHISHKARYPPPNSVQIGLLYLFEKGKRDLLRKGKWDNEHI